MPEENSNTPNPSTQNVGSTEQNAEAAVPTINDPSVPQPIPEPSKPKVSKKLVLIIAAILLLLAAGGTAAYFLVFKNQTTQPSPLGSPEPTAEAADPTADWKTYDNNQYKFEFKYPEDLTLTEESSSNAFYVGLKATGEDVRLDITKSSLSEARLKSTATLNYNDISWQQYPKSDYCDAGNCGGTPVVYETKKDNLYYSFNLFEHKSENFDFNQILSTFQFLNKNSNVSQKCGVCGPQGIHNVEGKTCAEGLTCKPGKITSLSYCVEEDQDASTCE